MGIRARTIALVSLVIVSLWGVLYVAGSVEARGVAGDLERREVSETLSRATAAVAAESDRLHVVTGDWAAWNDTYAFVKDPPRDPKYVASNLQDDSLRTLGVDVMAFYHADGRLAFVKTLDPVTGRATAAVPRGLRRYLSAHPSVLSMRDPRQRMAGIVDLPEGLMVVAAQPITTSDYRAPVDGTFLAGFFVKPADLARLGQLTRLRIGLFSADPARVPTEVAAARNGLRTTSLLVVPMSEDTVAGYEILPGLNGAPAAILRVMQARTTYALTTSSLGQSGAVLFGFGLALLGALGLTLEGTVLRRLAQLSGEVDQVRRAGDPSARLEVDGSDEIASVATDINGMLVELERSQSDLAYLASHDSITRLYNRRRFEEEVGRELSARKRIGGTGALLWFDLDHFKEINDSLGHAAGDQLLLGFASVLRTQTRGYDILARLGGDEFGMLMPHAGIEEATGAATRLLEVLESQTFEVDGHTVRVSASVGAVLYPEHGCDLDELLAKADLAMYRAKETGRGRLSVYTAGEGWRSDMTERMDLAERIVAALRDDRFTLYAQPTVSTVDGSKGPYELLLRMIDPDGQVVEPSQIIPTAERLGLIRDIDRWVARKAIRMLGKEHRAGRDTSFSVNLSGSAFSDPDLLGIIRDELAATGTDPSKLIIEITETTAISDIEAAQRFIRALRAIGCRFSIDDFGSGASTFYYLRHLAVDFLKIDGSLVRNLESRPADKHFVRAIVEMCKGLEIRTVAEYVESPELLIAVGLHGVDFAQGYEVGRPQPAQTYLDAPGPAARGPETAAPAPAPPLRPGVLTPGA